ncbi:hypothetical protein [Winogradskyella sp. PE311]|uniref:hypothetical protein n=1 Tax=Winogradskyella sp. PE311 TaxID=3366943 RepID=UPI00397EF5F9
MKKIAICLTILGFAGNIFAQNVNVDIASERGLMSKSASKKIIADGSPYISEAFSTIKIAQFKDQVFTGRYNAYNDEMEVRLPDGKIVALDNKADYSVTFTGENKTYKTASYITDNGTAKNGFLVVINSSDKYAVLKREYIKYYDKVPAVSSYQQDKAASFKREDDSYYAEINGKITPISQKKKTFLKAFPEQAGDLKTFIKKNKINLKKEADLMKTIKYLSTL